MEDRHTVDEQHQVAASFRQQLISGLETRLDGNLVARLATGNLQAVVDFQADFHAEVVGLRRITGDGDCATVDELVESQRRAQHVDLLDDLRHLALGEWHIAQQVTAPVVGVENAGPVVDELLLGGMAQQLIAPAVAGEQVNERRLELSLAAKWCGHDSSLDEHPLQQRRLGLLEGRNVLSLGGNELVEFGEDSADGLLFFEGGWDGDICAVDGLASQTR